MMAGPGVAAMLLPMIVSSVIDGFGWRKAVMLLAALTLAPLPLILLVFRGNGAASRRTIPLVARAPHVTLKSAQRMLYALVVSAFVFAAGAIAVRVAGLLGVGVVAGRLSIGWALDHLPPITVAQTSFALAAMGWAMLGTGWGMPIACILIGVALGAESDILAFLMARYYGLERFGFLYACA
jgi:hypothetical protein